MTHSDTGKWVLVTGGTGFVGAHCILQLLQKGYKVKTTLRSLNRKKEVLDMLSVGGITSFENLEFIEADLTKDANWNEAVKSCDYVLHVASPIFLRIPKDENEMIRPAVEGTLRVLKAARDAGVKRVVMTSNFGAVGYSHTDTTKVITEESWTDPNEKGLSAYNKSKVLAERAAWDFMAKEGWVSGIVGSQSGGHLWPIARSRFVKRFRVAEANSGWLHATDSEHDAEYCGCA